MPFKSGHKFGGSKPGIIKANTREIIEYLEERGYFVLADLIDSIEDPDSPAAVRMKGRCELMQYLYPKRKPQDYAGPEAKEMSILEAYAQARKFIADVEQQGLLDGKSGSE
ncbi:MAG: hypothetical protein ACRD5H_00060 [Nitrososphaerales archaeon]